MLGQLIEYNMKNIFLEKLYTKYGGETSPRPLSGKLKSDSNIPKKKFIFTSMRALQK